MKLDIVDDIFCGKNPGNISNTFLRLVYVHKNSIFNCVLKINLLEVRSFIFFKKTKLLKIIFKQI